MYTIINVIQQVGSTSFWSDNVCTAAATCAGVRHHCSLRHREHMAYNLTQMGSVLNAACCAGTCRKPLDIASLDYNNVGILNSKSYASVDSDHDPLGIRQDSWQLRLPIWWMFHDLA